MKMRLIAAAVAVTVAASLGTSVVLAQTPVSSTQPPGFTMSTEQRAAVKELLDAMNFKSQLQQISGAMTQGIPQMIDQTMAPTLEVFPAEKRAEIRAKANEAAQKAMARALETYSQPDLLQGFEDIAGRAHAKVFTVAEIRAIAAFYKSDIGQKLLFRQPQIAQEMMPEIVALLQPRMKALMEETLKEAKALVADKK
jgi:hypothetical protein